MKGLALHINGKKITVAPQEGNVLILATVLKLKNREESSLLFTGLDTTDNVHHEWYNYQLEMGDEFTIQVVDVLKNSEPIKTETRTSDELALEGKMKAYKALKEELESMGLL